MNYFQLSYIDTLFVKGGVLLGAIFSFLFGTWQEYLTILLVLQTLDVISGAMNGTKKMELSSRTMQKGMIKKFGTWIVIILAHMIDLILFNNHLVQTAVAFGFIANEGLSIAENLGEMGVLVSESIVKYLKQIKLKSEIEENPQP